MTESNHSLRKKLMVMLCMTFIGLFVGIIVSAIQGFVDVLFYVVFGALVGIFIGAAIAGVGWSFLISTLIGTFVGKCLSTPKVHYELLGALAGAGVGLILIAVIALWKRMVLGRSPEAQPMTEAEWNASSDPQSMLEWLNATAKPSDRKLRLFGCACVRRIWHLLVDERSRKAVEVAERYADGLATEQELTDAWEAASNSVTEWLKASEHNDQYAMWLTLRAATATLTAGEDAWRTATTTPVTAARASAIEAIMKGESTEDAAQLARLVGNQRAAQAHLLRDIFGAPFRPLPPLKASLLTTTVVELAQALYDERAFERMPALADALEQAGCREPEILAHCRSAEEHVRGCWVVDLLLGKE